MNKKKWAQYKKWVEKENEEHFKEFEKLNKTMMDNWQKLKGEIEQKNKIDEAEYRVMLEENERFDSLPLYKRLGKERPHNGWQIRKRRMKRRVPFPPMFMYYPKVVASIEGFMDWQLEQDNHYEK